jgi:hypothetical protein
VKRRWLLAVIAANLVALVALAFIYPHLMVSPGALASGHAELATDCFACHAPGRGAAASLCIACHALPDIGLRTTKAVALPQRNLKTSFHQELIEQDCMVCHSDHQGPRLARRSRKPFSHALLRPAVQERCSGCHAAPSVNLHRQITGNCRQCHSQERWKPATFEHGKLFVLDRDHNVACATCHQNDDYSRYTCYGCHEHTPAKIRSEHEEEGITDFENCVACHRDPGVEPGKEAQSSERGKREKD